MDEELNLLLAHLLAKPGEEMSEFDGRNETISLLVKMLETLVKTKNKSSMILPLIIIFTSTKSSTVSLMGLLETSCNMGRNVSKVTLASGPFSLE